MKWKILVLVLIVFFLVSAANVTAWYDSPTYPYRYLFKSNATFINYSSTMPVHVNDSAGICGKDYIARNCTIGDTCWVYCQNSGCCAGLVAVANDTDKLASYNASNMTAGYNPTTIWSSNYSVVYHLGEGTGDVNTSDATPNAKHANMISMTEQNWVAGKFGYALNFDGSTDWVNISEAWTVINYTHGTFTAWAYRTDWENIQAAASKIVSIYNDDVNNIEIGYIAGGTTIRFGRYSQAGWNTGICFTGVNVTGFHNNEWHHFAMTWSGTSFTNCYIDGVLMGTGANSNAWGGDGKPLYDYALGQWAPPNGQYWTGRIDEVKILRTPLTDAEIKKEFENGGGGDYKTGNLTALGTEEHYGVAIPTSVSLFLNGTQANSTYVVGSYANFTAVINVSGVTKLDGNYIGWALQTGQSPFTNTTYLKTIGNFYNLTAYFEGNATYQPSNATYFFNVTIPITAPAVAPIDYGINIEFISDKRLKIMVR